MSRTRLVALRVLIVLSGAVALSGCGGRTGTVSGRVTYKGSPVARAQVDVHPQNGAPRTAVTDDQGNYRIDGVPVGPCKVTVIPFPESSEADRLGSAFFRAARTGPTLPKESPARLPAKYAAPDSTPLTLDARSGDNPFDLTLAD